MPHSVKAVLGPTNTGKTHYAVERMLGYKSGMMGFPLRLLAREVYDRVVQVKGVKQVALLTGEEKIIPEGARYFLCTAESMPRHRLVDFVAIDEVQMASDSTRGHIFTDHILHSRGQYETLLLGAETAANILRRLIPDLEIISRPRFSALTYVKPAKLSRLPRRSAIVGFSASEVYGIAELLKRTKGGAAIVMGALSPRTRNAQVALYQAGEVDFLVATDAIGMGLNMDIHHVAFASLAKFDGRQFRTLYAHEAAQIAGRAGRHSQAGSFSTLTGIEAMDQTIINQIEEHQFQPLEKIFWRNSRLDYSSSARLIRSLERSPASTQAPYLLRPQESDDLTALKRLLRDHDIADRAKNKARVTLLWDVAQIPDFRKISPQDHWALMAQIYQDLTGPDGAINEDFIAKQVKHLDNIHGDIDTLAGRIAGIRVWTYISHRSQWLKEARHWAEVARGIEDKLSDALHERLTQRFVDRRTAILMRALRQKGDLSVTIDEDTQKVSVENQDIGTLKGFSFKPDSTSGADALKTLKHAAGEGLKAEILRRAKLFANIGIKTLTIDFSLGLSEPRLSFEGAPFAKLYDTGAAFAPRVKLLDDSLLEGEAATLVLEKTQEWLDKRIAEKLDPLLKLTSELNGEQEASETSAPLSGLVRGLAYRLLENYGILTRANIDGDIRKLDQEQRKALRRFGVRIGAHSLYIPFLLKPHATELRLMLWAMKNKGHDLPSIPTPGMVWCERADNTPNDFYILAGFLPAGAKAVRVDMVERLSDTVRPLGQTTDWFEVTPEIMGLVGLSGDDFAGVMQAIGYHKEQRQVLVPAQKPETKPETKTGPEAGPLLNTASETVAAIETTDAQSVAEEGAPAKAAPDAPTELSPKAETETEAEITAESAPGVMVERAFFQWAPAKQRRPNNAKRQSSPDEDKSNSNAEARKPRSRRDNLTGKYDRAPKAHPHRQARLTEARKDTTGNNRSYKKPERAIDPDSPFAALAGLKAQLSGKK